MLDNLYKLKITKNEIALYQMIEESDNFDYSLSEIANIINLTRQTVVKSLKTLVQNKLVQKIDFFIGKVRRCRYIIMGNSLNGQNLCNGQEGNILYSQNLCNGQENSDTANGKSVLGHKKTSLKHHFKTSTITNDMIDNNIKNNIYINPSINQSNDTPLVDCCQEGKIKKFFSKFLENKSDRYRGEKAYAYWNKKFKLDNLALTREYYSVCKNVVTNLLKQNNADLINFFETKNIQQVHRLFNYSLMKLEHYIYDIASSVDGYFRTMLLRDIACFDALEENWYCGLADDPLAYQCKMQELAEAEIEPEISFAW